MTEQEIEIKLKLYSEKNYLKFLDSFLSSGHQTKVISQENYFFDSPDRILSKNGWALRLRLQDDKAIITAKGISSKSGSAAVRDEINQTVDQSFRPEDINRNPDSIFEYTGANFDFLKTILGEKKLALLVSFENKRTKIKFPVENIENIENLFLEVDKTTFQNSQIDYELEVELENIRQLDKVEEALKVLFSSLSIPYQVERESKFGRALKIAGLI